MLDLHKTPHMCVDWERLMKSMEERVIDPREIEGMKNPIYSGAMYIT